ncbi:MAG: glycerate kinase [Planctomycetales bacterium]
MWSAQSLRNDALAIWQAGVSAVDSERLVAGALSVTGETLVVCGKPLPLAQIGRIAVVGGGKAGAGMAAAVEQALGAELVDQRVQGWVNVPADCVRPLRKIHLHPARPAGVNEPTEAGVAGARRILEIVSGLDRHDLCLVLISGGGSALLPAPATGLTLADKQGVTRFLMHAGATIQELNTVRKPLSQIKGGGLARACRADRLISLIISDVVGDPLDVIASGPTVADTFTPAAALAVLQKFGGAPPAVPQAVFDVLYSASTRQPAPPLKEGISNHIIGNNAVAVREAATRAMKLGYTVSSLGSANQGEAAQAGRELAELCQTLARTLGRQSPPMCILSGGEPVVHLAPEAVRGLGGRNQQLVLAALESLWDDGLSRVTLLSGGTDGEDGPTDAAGALADAEVLRVARNLGLSPGDYLARSDAYRFFEQVGGLIRTGPTHTNVMDLRVALVAPPR